MTPREQFKEWLARNLQDSGWLGCGLGFSDKTWYCLPLSESLEVAAMETAMRCLADAFDVAGLHHVPSLEQKWTFEKRRVFCARRPDKTFLAVFLENQEDPDFARVRKLIDEFKLFQSTEIIALPAE